MSTLKEKLSRTVKFFFGKLTSGEKRLSPDAAAKRSLEYAKFALHATDPAVFEVETSSLCRIGIDPLSWNVVKTVLELEDVLKESSLLVALISKSFSSVPTLNASFVLSPSSPRPLEADRLSPIDWVGVQQSYEGFLKGKDDDSATRKALISATVVAGNAFLTFKREGDERLLEDDAIPRASLILLANPLLDEPELQIPVFYPLLKGMGRDSSPRLQKRMADLLSEVDAAHIEPLVRRLQQYITIQQTVNTADPFDIHTFAAFSVMRIFHEANELHRTIDFRAFYNDAVNMMDHELLVTHLRHWGPIAGRSSELTVVDFPFLLNPSLKTVILRLVSQMEQRESQREAVLRLSLFSEHVVPFFVLRVHREHILLSALNGLSNAPVQELMKPLRVVFEGEEGVDEGGVRKEFFQIIVRDLFDPSFGMFVYNEETRSYWFNRNSLENDSEFRLIGLLLGLAIYNDVILDIHFPLVVYKKLLGGVPSLDDMKRMDVSLGNSLQQLLDFEGDVEAALGMTFEVTYDAFGEKKTYNLMSILDAEGAPAGASAAASASSPPIVTDKNRRLYVDLYVKDALDFSVRRQFDEFAKGFRTLVKPQMLALFEPDELELLVCGNPHLDFDALEENAQYDDGYTAESLPIRWFWTAVKKMPLDEKKKVLFFITGSDRAPVGGLGQLRLIIIRQGPDSEKLPTAHTCFNLLLLPEYSSLERLEQKLQVAIHNSEGFGLR